MKFPEFMQQLHDFLPEATVGEDNDGQIVIYTDKTLDDQDNVVDFGHDDPQEATEEEA